MHIGFWMLAGVAALLVALVIRDIAKELGDR
jgi:hypothetical protein